MKQFLLIRICWGIFYCITHYLHCNVFDFEKSDQYPILSRNLSDSAWVVLCRIQG